KGGPAIYQLPIFLALGVEVDLLTSVDDEYVKNIHGFKNIFNLKTDKTTSFKFGINNEKERRLKLIQKPINYIFEKIPNVIFENNYNFVIFSGIAGELEIDFINKLISYLKSDYYILDLQSIVRTVAKNGDIKINKLENEILQKLQEFDIIKGSDMEMNLSEIIEKNSGKNFKNKILIETTNKGVINYLKNTMKKFNFDIVPENNIIDDTGSGDIFLACFSWMFIRTKNIEHAINFAHRVSSDLLRVNGVLGIKEADILIKKILTN
ncbi:MAG: hypothetical protein ACPHM3_03390, partial [Candidatus Kariarchaeum pelagius]